MVEKISEKLIRDVIEKGLDSLGQSPKQAVWFLLEKDYGFDRENLPKNLEKFEGALQKTFGLGYNFLKSLFIHYLEEATGENLKGCASLNQCIKRLYTKAKEKAKDETTEVPCEIGMIQPKTIVE